MLYFENAYWVAGAWILLNLLTSWRRAVLQLIALFLFALYSSLLFSSTPTPGAGRAFFAIHSVQRHHSPFASGWLYKGTLSAFESNDGRWKTNLPCSIVFRGNAAPRRLANRDYMLEGTLSQQDRFAFTFKPKAWESIEGSFSLAELRFRVKERIRAVLHQRMEPRAADFITALFTGEIDDRALRFEFGRLGLQHILAISGFHFALVAAFVAALLRHLCPYRPRLFALLAAALLYFFLVGNSPPVLRSFLAAALFLSGRLLQRRSSGLNLLGACLLFEITLDPLAALQIGFQLSFLSCGAILLLNAPVRRCLAWLLPQRSLKESFTLTLPSQFAYVCLSFFNRALSLTIAVNLALFPLLLHHFHRFPFLGLFYNLFIPTLAALCLLLFLPGLALHGLSPLLAIPLFKGTGFLAGELLEIVGNPPALLDFQLSASLPGWAIAPWLGSIFLLGIYFQQRDLHFSGFSSKTDVRFYGGRSSVG